MKEIRWLDEHRFAIGDVRFQCSLHDYSLETSTERFAILKDRGTLESYATVLTAVAPKTVLEFGIFQGGSPALFSLWFDLEKLVGVDVCSPVAAFDDFCHSLDGGKRIRPYYGVSQTDQQRVEQILLKEFGTNSVDVVIDDASHHYAATRRTFEIAFPFLRPGGYYAIEDWGWAHWPDSTYYMGETALSMLIMELVMLSASRSDLVSEVRVFPSVVFVRKSPTARPVAHFDLDALYRKRGIELVGSRNSNLGGVTSLLAARIADSMRRKLQRLGRKIRRSPQNT